MNRHFFIALCLVCCSSSLLYAQGAPGLAPDSGDSHEPNNTVEKATAVKSGEVVEASIFPTKDIDHLAIEVPEPGQGILDILIRDVPAEIAPLVQVLDPEQKELGKVQRRSGESLFLRLFPKAPGKYTIALRDGRADWQDEMDNKASAVPLKVKIELKTFDTTHEPNNEVKQATAIEFGKMLGAALHPADDKDFYKVSVPEPGVGEITAHLTNPRANSSFGLTVYDSEGKQRKSHWSKGAGQDVVLTYPTRAAGDLYLEARGSVSAGRYRYSSGKDTLELPYSLRVEYHSSGDAFEPNNELKAAAALPIGEPTRALLFPQGDRDFYRVDIPKPGRGRLQIIVRDVPDTICPRVEIYNEQGKVIDRFGVGPGAELRYERELEAAGPFVFHLQDGNFNDRGRYTREDDDYSKRPYTILALFTPVVDEHEPNNKHDEAKTIEVGKPVNATLFPVKDADFYKFTLPEKARGFLRIRVDGFNDKIVPFLRLYDVKKKEVKNARGGRLRPAALRFPVSSGGDFFVLVQDAEFNNGRYRHGWNDSSSPEPYSLVVSFEQAPASSGEPNDGFEQAEPLTVGKPRQATLHPGADTDFYKFEITDGQTGPIRVEAGEFRPGIHPGVVVYNSEKKPVLTVRRHSRKIVMDAELANAGTYYLQVHTVQFNWHRWISPNQQFDPKPYTVLVAPRKLLGPADAPDPEPAHKFAEAALLQPGKPVLARIEAGADHDWFKVPVSQPSEVDLLLSDAPNELDLQLYVYFLPKKHTLQFKKMLYLHGPRGDFNLDHHCPEIEPTRLEHNTPEAKAAFANVEKMKQYDAIVVDCLHDPNHLDLPNPRVQQNITSYVQSGGRFIVLTPFGQFKLFGVSGAEPGRWHEDSAVDLGVKHPLLEGIEKGRVRWWDSCESVSWLVDWRAAGFEMLYGHASDPEQNAVTVLKKLGQGYFIFDSQTIGHHRNWPEADWKLRAYLGLPNLEFVGHYNDTLWVDHRGGRGVPEFARLFTEKPGTYFVYVSDRNHRAASGKPYRMSVDTRAVRDLPRAHDDLFSAERIDGGTKGEGGEVEFVLPTDRRGAWFRIDGKDASELSVTVSQAPPHKDPQIAIYERPGNGIEEPKLPDPKRVLYLHGERGDFNLDRHFVDIHFDRIEWNSERAHAVLLKSEGISSYDAVVVDAITRPTEFGLGRETVQKTIESYVRNGGRFIVLSPLCKVKLFGVESLNWDWWHDNVQPCYPTHHLMARRTRDDTINRWPGAETVGYWGHRPDDGFKMLFADWRNPNRFAITLVKELGKGSIVLDTHALGHNSNAGPAAWKFHRYLGQEPLVRHLATYNNTLSAGLGEGEHLVRPVRATSYYLRVFPAWPTRSSTPMRLQFELKTPERPLEPDDSPGLAKQIAFGEEARASIYPGGDEDWWNVKVARKGAMSLRVTDVPDNLDPAIVLKKRIPIEKPLRVLYLEGAESHRIDPDRFAGVDIARVDAYEPRAATALDELQSFDMVILSSLFDARQFGMNTKENHEKLRRFVEAGGRCLVLRPFGCSFAENSPQMGAVLESFSSQWDGGAWHAIHATDGKKVPGQHGHGWCCGRGAKFPHTMDWSFGGGSRRLDRLVFYNHSNTRGARAKDLEILAGNDTESLRPVGKFVAAQNDQRQEFRFNAVTCKLVRLSIASNYGHGAETQLGEVEFYGPDSIDGFFGVALEGWWPADTVACLEPLHWIMNRRMTGQVKHWPGNEIVGWWIYWREQGFKPVCTSHTDVQQHGVTLVKRVGKGWVVLDSQSLTEPKNAGHAAWKLHNYFDAATEQLGEFDKTRRKVEGGDEIVDLTVVEPADYLVGVRDRLETGNYHNQSSQRYTFSSQFRVHRSAYEPRNDRCLTAPRLTSGEALKENIFPHGDVDWFRFAVEQPGVAEITVDQVPSNVNPVIEVHRTALAARPVKVLLLACLRATDLDRRDWGPAPVQFTRVDAGTAAEAAAMDGLSGYDVVVLEGLDDVRRFGMDRKETFDKIQRYAEAGGTFVVLAPRYYSYSLISPETGAMLESWSSAYDLHKWHPLNLSDGYAERHNNRGGWRSAQKAKLPHWFVFRIGGSEPVTIDRMVVMNTAQRKEGCVKEIEALVSDTGKLGSFKSVGKFQCKQLDDPQEFRFDAVKARYVRVVIHSNHGGANETQVGDVAFYGPGRIGELFGVRHFPGRRSGGRYEYAMPDHWIVSRHARGKPEEYAQVERWGFFTDWEKAGFQLVLAEKVETEKPEEATKRGVTLCKPVGKGFIVLDTQDLAKPGTRPETVWQLHNYLDQAPTRVSVFDETQRTREGGREQFRLFVEPGLYCLRISDAQNWRSSLDKLRLLVGLETVPRPLELNDTPETATWLLSGRPVRSSIFPMGDLDWFRLDLAKKGPIRFEILDVPDELDPKIEVYAAGKFDQPLRQFDRTCRGQEGCPEMFAFTPQEPGEYFIKVHSKQYYDQSASRGTFTVMAAFEEVRDPVQPRLASVLPVEKMRDVSLRPRIVANFDRPLSPKTVGKGSISVQADVSGTVPGEVKYDPSSYQVTFTPARDLEPDETVAVTVKDTIAGVYGGKLGEDKTWTFSTLRLQDDAAEEITVQILLARGNTVGAGESEVTVVPSGRLRAAPTLTVKTPRGVAPVEGLSRDERGQWVGKLTIPVGTPSGPASFELKAADRRGRPVTKITEGQTFQVDTVPPPAMGELAALPAARGKARLTWKRPGQVDDLGGYRLYRSDRESNRPAEAVLAKSVVGASFLSWDDQSPKDGTWFYFVTAVDRAGNEGKPSAAVRVVTDRVGPKNPVADVVAKVEEKPRIDIVWKKSEEADLAGYSVFRFTQGEDEPDLHTVTPLTQAPPDRTSLQDFPKDGAYRYVVVSRDQSGNLGPHAEPADVVLDTRRADVSFYLDKNPPLPQGDHKLSLRLSEPLAADPELVLRMPDRSTRKVELTKKDDLNYEAVMKFTLEDPEGWVGFQISGEDRYGNKGLRIIRTSSFQLDTGPPKSLIYRTPGGRYVGIGKVQVKVEFNETVKDGAKLWYTLGDKRFDVAIKRTRGRWFAGEFALTADSPNGPAEFHTSATDRFDHTGGVVVRAKDFVIDTIPSEPPGNVRVRPAKENSLEVSWSPPTREPIQHFRVYGSTDASVKPAKEVLLADKVRQPHYRHKGKQDEILWFVVTAVDRAGNESPPSKVVKGVPDIDPPPPPRDLQVSIEHDGRLRLVWGAPQVDEPIRYLVYRLAEADAPLEKQKPVHETEETFVIDDPQKDAIFHFRVTAADEAGNQSKPASAEPIDYDVIPPTASVEINPTSGWRGYRESYHVHYQIGVLSAGEKTVVLVPSEEFAEPPTLRYRSRSMETPREIELTEADGKWQGKITIPEKRDDGDLVLFYEGVDLKGNHGDVITKGKGNRFWIDTTPPEVVPALKTTSLSFGRVALTWSPPPGDRTWEVKYSVFRSSEALKSIEGLEPVASGLAKPKHEDKPAEDGTYHYIVVAIDQAGNVGKVLESVPGISDGKPPASPTEMKSEAKDEVRLFWTHEKEEGVTYRLLRNADIIATSLATAAFADVPESNGTYEYSVIAIDAAGNESAQAARTKVEYTSTRPAAAIVTEPAGPIRSTFRAVLTCDQELAQPPDLFLHLAYGKPVRIRTDKRDDVGREWVGSVAVSKETPNGRAKFTFLGVSKDGIRGTRVGTAAEIVIDTRPPSASIFLSPRSPVRPGPVSIKIEPSEELKETPTLSYTTMGTRARAIELTKEKSYYVGKIEITAEDQDGIAFFEFTGIDMAGNVGSHLGGSQFTVDSHPPKQPKLLSATPKRHGYVELAWQPPVYKAAETPDEIAGYNVYASGADFTEVTDMRPLATRLTRTPYDVRPVAEGNFFFAVTTVDRSGLESPPSNRVECVADRSGPQQPKITKAEAKPGSIDLAWESGADAVAFSVYVHVPGERNPRLAAEKIKEPAYTYAPLLGGDYYIRVRAFDRFDHASDLSKSAVVKFEQRAPLASLKLPGKAVGYGTVQIGIEATQPLARAPKLRFVPSESPPVSIDMQGSGKEWRGKLVVDEKIKGGSGRFEYEGVSLVDGKEVTGRGILTGDRVTLDFTSPTVAIQFLESQPKRDRKVILSAGRFRFHLRASEPLKGKPKLVFTPRGKPTQEVALTKKSDVVWGGILVIDKEIGDGSGIFEFEGEDLQGNRSDTITENRNVEIDTTAPNKITKIRAVPLPGGKVRVDWIPPYFDDGKLDKEANTFYLYRGESEIKDITGLEPYKTVERVLGTIDEASVDREYFYAVAAIDKARNVGEVSKNVSVHVDKTPPGIPCEPRVKQLETGAVHLSWEAPEDEKPFYYNVYLEDHPVLTTKGLTPRNKGVTWTEIYGSPKVNGRYYFAITSVDDALNESEPSKSVLLDYRTIPPVAMFTIEPDIWLRDGEYPVRLKTTKDLIEPPKVEINSESGKRYPISFEGSGSRWRSAIRIDETYPQGTYGFIFRGLDEEGNIADEIQRGPLFHVDKTPTLPPGELRIEPDSTGTPGAVVLHWVTPKREDQQTEVPHFYNIYRSTENIASIKGMNPVHTYKVIYENLDDYHYTDMPPDNGTYYYVVTALDMARNESVPSNVFKVTVQSDSPRATIELFAITEGGASPAPKNHEGVPLLGKGKARVVLKTTSPLKESPKIAWHLKRQEDKLISVAMKGEGTTWEGELDIDADFEDTKTAFLKFEGTSQEGTKGTFIRKGEKFRIDTLGPTAEIIIPSAYKMKVNVKTNELEAPSVRGGLIALKLTTDEDLAQAPDLTYTLDDGGPVPIPMTGFGRKWRGYLDIPLSADQMDGKFQFEGVDRAGNVSTAIAKRRYPYETDGAFPTPRKIASYATTGGYFRTDTFAPAAPFEVETEMRRLGVAVIKWKEPEGGAVNYNLYRSLTPIASIQGLKPIKARIYATIMVDDPPVDGNYFYAVTAEDLAGNESELSECKNVFIDTIKPELKIKAVPSGDDFVILMDENAPETLSLTINFPGQERKSVELGGSSGKLKKYSVRTMPDGRRGIVLPQRAEFFNGRVEVVVHSPDPEGNIVEAKTEVEMKKISSATGGEVESVDQGVKLVIPPGLEPVIPKGPKEVKRVRGYEHLFFIQYANIPDKKPSVEEGKKRTRDQVDPLPPGLEVVGRPYVIQMNLPPEEPIELRASATQADLSELMKLTPKLTMQIPTLYSDAVEDPEYLKSRLKVVKWMPARSDDEAGRWEYVPAIEVDIKNKRIIAPASDITTYVVVSERTPPSIRELKPDREESVTEFRPEISCLIVDKGTGVAVGAENRIVMTMDGHKIEEKFLEISKGDPTEVLVTYKPPADLKPGTHTVGVRAEDVVENVANVKWQFAVDNEPPVFESVSPRPGERLPVSRPVLQAHVSDQGGIDVALSELEIDGDTVPASYLSYDQGTQMLTYPCHYDLSSGKHEVKLVAIDRAGLSSEKAWSFITDLNPPEVAGVMPIPDSIVATDTQAIGLRAEDAFGRTEILDLRIDGRKVSSAKHGQGGGFAFDSEKGLSYEAPEPFSIGDHRISVLFADEFGNSTTKSWTFTVKDGAPPASALDVEKASKQYEAVAAKADPERIKQLSSIELSSVQRLVKEAETLAAEHKLQESAAKYEEATTKLEELNREAEKQEREREEAVAQYEKAKKGYEARAAEVDRERIRKYLPDAEGPILALAEEAEVLGGQGTLVSSAEKYLAAKTGLDEVDQKAQALERAEKEAAARYEAAKKKHEDAAAKVDLERLRKHMPATPVVVSDLVAQAQALASQGDMAKGALEYGKATAELVVSDKRAQEIEQALKAAAEKRYNEEKTKFEGLLAKTDRERLAKYTPEAQTALDGLVAAAKQAAADGELDKSADAYSAASAKLAEFDAKAQEVERAIKAASAALVARFDAAKKKYAEVTAKVNEARIRKYLPDESQKLDQLVEQADGFASAGKLAECATAYEKAAGMLPELDEKALGLQRAEELRIRKDYEAAKTLFEELLGALDRERLRRHRPKAEATILAVVEEAKALAKDGRLRDSRARYLVATEDLSKADKEGEALEKARQEALAARLKTAMDAYAGASDGVNRERLAKYVPDELKALEDARTAATRLYEQGRLEEGVAKYEELKDKLLALDEKSSELERQAVLAGLAAAKKAYAEAAGKVDRARIRKYLPGEAKKFEELVTAAEASAVKGELLAGTTGYRNATEQLLKLEQKALGLQRAEELRVQKAHEAAKTLFAETSGGIDRPLLLRHVPDGAAEVQATSAQAKALEEDGQLEESAAKYRAAAERLTRLAKEAEGLEKARQVALAAKLKAAEAAWAKAMDQVNADRLAKYLPAETKAFQEAQAVAASLSKQGKLEEGAARYEELTEKALALDKRAAELERQAVLADFTAAKKEYLGLRQGGDEQALKEFTADELPGLERLLKEAADLEGQERLEAGTGKYREATKQLKALQAKAKAKKLEAIAAAKLAQGTAREAYLKSVEQVDHEQMKEFEPEAVTLVAKLVKEADGLAGDARYSESAKRYHEAREALVSADRKAKEKALAELARRKARYVAAEKDYAELAGKANRPRIRTYLSGQIEPIDALVVEAGRLAENGRFEEGAAKLAEAAKRLGALAAKAAELHEAKQKELRAKVEAEMAAIREHLQKDEVRLALDKLTKSLPALWMEHRRADWPEYLAFVNDCQKKSPTLRVIGRTRLGVLERKLGRYIADEKSWNQLLSALQKVREAGPKAVKVRQFLRENPRTIYREDAEKLVEKLLADQ